MTAEYTPSRWWRLKGSFLRLEGSNCEACGKLHIPGRDTCPDCGHREGTEIKPPAEVEINIPPQESPTPK